MDRCRQHERTCSKNSKAATTSTTGPWTCTRCAQTFMEDPRFQKHLQNREFVTCRHCDKNFCRKDRCEQHKRTCSKNSKTTTTSTTGSWTCTRCAQIFEKYPRFQKHLQNREFLTCRHCKRNFCRKDRCEQHERTEHTQAVRKSLFNEYETNVIIRSLKYLEKKFRGLKILS